MNRTARLASVAVAAILNALAPVARAEPPPAASPGPASTPAAGATPAAAPAPVPADAPQAPLADALTGDAKRDYESGRLLYNDGDFAGALVKFRRAYDGSGDPRLLWNEAACEKNLRHYAKVIGLMRRVLAEGGPRLTDAARAQARELLHALEPLTARLELHVQPDGATVYVDGELLGTTPLAGAPLIDLGTRQLRVVKDGYEESVTALDVGGSAAVSADISLRPAVHQAGVTVLAEPGEGIALDGHVVAIERWQGTLASGTHALRVTAPGKQPFETEFVVEDGQARTLRVALQDEPRAAGLPTWVWIAGGAVVLAGASVGGYFLFKPGDQAAGPSVVGTIAPGTVQLVSHR